MVRLIVSVRLVKQVVVEMVEAGVGIVAQPALQVPAVVEVQAAMGQ